MHSQGTISVIFLRSRSPRVGTLRSPRISSQWRSSARLPGWSRSGRRGSRAAFSLSVGFMPRAPLQPTGLMSHSRTARLADAEGVPVAGWLCYPYDRCRICEETVMTVGHILNQKGTAVVTARPDDTVHEVGKLLTSRKVGAVVIMDGETIAGIVSERDIVRAVAERGEAALKLGVSEIM